MNHYSVAMEGQRRQSFTRFVRKHQHTILEVSSAAFILLFLYTALSKSANIRTTVAVLERTPLFSSFPEFTAWLTVVAEYSITFLLFFSRTRKLGMLSSFVLMSSFTIYILYMKFFVPNLPCTCGGVISKLSWTEHLLFNVLFSVLALGCLLLMRTPSKVKIKDKSVRMSS